jgi:hypothetical protein
MLAPAAKAYTGMDNEGLNALKCAPREKQAPPAPDAKCASGGGKNTFAVWPTGGGHVPDLREALHIRNVTHFDHPVK